MVDYILTMNSDQCKETLKAVELLMRLKIGQYQELTWDLVSTHRKGTDDSLVEADEHLRAAFNIFNKDKKPSEYKDTEWYVLYNLYQVLRKAIHDAEHPEGKGIDSWEPMQLTEVPLPKITWEKKE